MLLGDVGITVVWIALVFGAGFLGFFIVLVSAIGRLLSRLVGRVGHSLGWAGEYRTCGQPRCGHLNPQRARYCARCGHPLLDGHSYG